MMRKTGRFATVIAAAATLALGFALAPDAATSAASYHVNEGPTFNSATGSNSAKYAINNKLKDAIAHSPRKSEIRVMSWNIMSRAATNQLLDAQHRGVTVKVLMDASNWSNKVPNPQFKRLKYGLAKANKYQSAYGTSYAAVCQGSCRSSSGSAHSKFYMFSQTGTSKWVVMEGSANFTLAAATNQWNDLYTWVRPEFYNFTRTIFSQMAADKKISGPWREIQSGNKRLAFSPEWGKQFSAKPNYGDDPMLRALKEVDCKNAKYGNRYHKTVIRYFPDVIRGDRGLAIANRLKTLWNARCDVHVGYTVLSYDAYRVLTSRSGRGRVPIKHMAVDKNRDGQFDLYFHLKALAINGNINGNRAAWRLIQGSANSSGLSTISDENQAIVYASYPAKRYLEHMDYWFAHSPGGRASSQSVGAATAARMATLSPNELLAEPDAAPVEPAQFDDGYVRPGTKVINPQTGKLVDPYANIDED